VGSDEPTFQLQVSKNLQKATYIDKRPVNLRIIFIAYLTNQSLVSIFLTESQHCRQMQTKIMAANVGAYSLFSV